MADGLLSDGFVVIGFDRVQLDDDSFRRRMGEGLRLFATTPVDNGVWEHYTPKFHYVQGDLSDLQSYRALEATLATVEEHSQTLGNRLFYAATPPNFFVDIVRNLGPQGLMAEQEEGWKRIIIEKPFGYDLDSAVKLNREIGKYLSERQIYRIDHYLGKETVQNILVFRFANGIFEPVWNRNYIDHVQIMVAETIGIEARGGYYDQSGAVRDIVQNHLFQLLSFIAMEPPISFDAEEVRNEKLKVLRAVRPLSYEYVLTYSVRGQYGEGNVEGERVSA